MYGKHLYPKALLKKQKKKKTQKPQKNRKTKRVPEFV